MADDESRYSLTYGLPHGSMGSGGIKDRLDTSNGIQSVLQDSARTIAAHMGKLDGFDVLPGKQVVGTLWEFSP